MTWIRHRDVHIMTVGEYTYTTDERFVSRHNSATGEWVLVIKYVQERDAGIYECQIPSAPPRAYQVTLNIVGEYFLPSFLKIFVAFSCKDPSAHDKEFADEVSTKILSPLASIFFDESSSTNF